MAFAVGDYVHITALGRGVVREVRNGGRYAVEIKGRVLVVDGSRLTGSANARKAPRAVTGEHISRTGPARDARGDRPFPSTSIDLHGMTTAEALAAVDAFLNDAILAGMPEVHIVHGRGGGRLKAAVHARLKQVQAVRSYRLNSRNPGVTTVLL